MAESFSEFARRRARELAGSGQNAWAETNEEFRKAIRAGQDLGLKTAHDVARFGGKLLDDASGNASKAVANTRSVLSTANRTASSVKSKLDNSPQAKKLAGHVGRIVGNPAGVVRGGVHTVEGLIDGGKFVVRLANPLDDYLSPPGQSASDQLRAAGQSVVGYAQRAVANPQVLADDLRAKARQMRVDLDPSASPVAPTFAGEFKRNFDIGQNQGELAFDVGSLVVGGPGARAVNGLGAVSKVGKAEKYLAQGFSPRAAAHLAKPYPASNMGHHFISRDTKLPKILGGGPLPRTYSDGPFNKLAPPGMSRGDFYELHYRVDPRFYGTSVLRERWSGRDLEFDKYGSVGRIWYGSPAPLKARVGGLAAAAGGGLHDLGEDNQGW